MKIGIVSAWNKGFEDIARITFPNREQYADKHGYELVTWRSWTGSRHPTWARMRLAIEQLPYFDYLFVMDTDAIITNLDWKLEWLISDHDIVATHDINGFNSGMLLLKHTPWCNGFLAYYWEAGKRFLHHVSQDQTCLAYHLMTESPEHWRLAPQRDMNSFLYEEYGYDYPKGQWQKGDFILHLPGMENERRKELLTQYLKQL